MAGRVLNGRQRHFHAAGLGVAAAALGLLGLLQLDAVLGHAQGLEGLGHGQGAALGQLGVLRGIARGVVEARNHGLLAFGDALDHIGQRFGGAGGQVGLGGGEEELHHAVLHAHAGDVLSSHGGGRSGHRLGGGCMRHAALVDHRADHGRDDQQDQGKQETQGKTLLAVVVGTAERHGMKLRK